MLGSEKITLNTKQMSEVMEMLEQEELVQEKTDAEEEEAAAAVNSSATKTDSPKAKL